MTRMMTEEHKRKIGLANKGRVKTKTQIELHRQKMVGKKASEATREKMRQARLGYKLSDEAREKIRQKALGRRGSNLGKKFSAEHRRKISESQKGKIISLDHIERISGENSGQWRGDKVGYGGLHVWVRKQLGKPDTCVNCNKSGLSGRKIHWANKSHQYKRDLTDWLRLCVSCHKAYDSNKLIIE